MRLILVKSQAISLYSPDPQPGQFGWSLDLDVDQEGVCRSLVPRHHELYFNGEGRIPDAGAAYVLA